MPISEKTNCRPELVQAYADGQLAAAEALEMERHLRTCANCATALQVQQALSGAIGGSALYHKAPTSLHRRLAASLNRGEPDAKLISAPPSGRWPQLWRGLAMAASAAFLIVLGAAIAVRFNQPSAPELVLHDIIQSHVRSLIANHVADVISSNQHTVKPWFNGRLNFAPPVKDLAAAGFPLFGGRIDLIEDRSVAVLIYRRRAHYINLFIWPSDATAKAQAISLRGYNIIHWDQAGMAYWAVSDVNRAELEQFVHILRSVQ